MLDDPIVVLPAVGAKRAALFSDFLGVNTVEDLLFIRPYKYVDLSSSKLIDQCLDGEYITLKGTVTSSRITGSSKKFLEITVSDESGSIKVLFFGGFKYHGEQLSLNTEVVLSGKVSRKGGPVMVHPEYELNDSSVNTGRILPYYSIPGAMKDKGVSSKVMRKIIKHACEDHLSAEYDDILPDYYSSLSDLTLGKALYLNHFPMELSDIVKVRERLAFSELFFLQILVLHQKKLSSKTFTCSGIDIHINNFISLLPFTLTKDQHEVLKRLSTDIAKGKVLNNLLQGDVGSGKTAVAAGLCYVLAKKQKQSAFMAPTSLLARQHYETLTKMLPDINIALLTGATTPKEREQILFGLESGSIDIAVGTHALIQNSVSFKDLSLAVIDEQHRFGIQQRFALRKKSQSVHLLSMSATPIPRSLALTLYGDMEVSFLKEKPAGRIPVKTILIAESRTEAMYRSVEKYINLGQQCFFVLPLIEANEDSELSSVEEYSEKLKKRFKNHKISMLHGKMRGEEKEKVMNDFLEKSSSILVSTTVIEVGIDVPNATVIVIVHPERFGLAQLHQLRGRVGRGNLPSFCVLCYNDSIPETTLNRINVLAESDDGFYIAEKDLEMRGAGEITGLLQSGFNSDFVYADIINDRDILLIAREKAQIEIDNSSTIDFKHNMNNRYLRIIS